MSEGIKIGGLNTEHVKTNPDGKTEGFTIGKDRVDAKDNIFYSVSRTNHNETFQRFVDYEEVDIIVNDIYDAAGEDEILTEEEQRELFVKWWTQDINDEGVKPGDRGYIKPNKAEDYTDELFKKHKKQFEEVLSDKKKFAFDIDSARVSDEEMLAIIDEQAGKVEEEIEQLDMETATEGDIAKIVADGVQEAQEAVEQTQDPWGQEQVVDVKKDDVKQTQSDWMTQYNSKSSEELTQEKLQKLNELSANVQDEELAGLINSAMNSKNQKAYTETVKQIKSYVNKNYKDLPEGLARNTKGGSGTILNFVQTGLTDANGRALFVAPMEASSSYGHMAFAYPDVDDKVALKAFVEANSYEGGPFEAGKDYDFNAVANIMAKNKGKNFFYPDLSNPSEEQKQKVAEYKNMQELLGALDSLKLKDIQAQEEKIAEAVAEVKAEVKESIAEEKAMPDPEPTSVKPEPVNDPVEATPAVSQARTIPQEVDKNSLLLSDRDIEVDEEFLADIGNAATTAATVGGLLAGSNVNANVSNVLADIQALSLEQTDAITQAEATEEVAEVKDAKEVEQVAPDTEEVTEEQVPTSEENPSEAVFDLSSMSAQERTWYEYYLNNLAPGAASKYDDLPSINEVREATLKDIEDKLGVTYADGKVEIKNPELIDNPQLRMFYEIINQR